jgi:calcium-dependent protein kinase
MWSMGVIIFMILTGSPPFTGKTDEEIMSAILKDDYKVPDTLSDSAKDLISKLLELDVNKRLTAEQALKHPWIENSDQNSDKNLANVVSKFATFSSKTLIKKTVSSLMLKQTEDADKLMSLFKMLDVDGDRLLDQSELASYVQNHCFDDVSSQNIASDLINVSPESKQVIDFIIVLHQC